MKNNQQKNVFGQEGKWLIFIKFEGVSGEEVGV